MVSKDFNHFALKTLYLSNPRYAPLIDLKRLERYLSVGGVRIEDDILITKHGYENLTLAPKGQKMLDIIRDGAKCEHGVACSFHSEASR